MKKLFLIAGLFIGKSCYSQVFIGLTDKDVQQYFPNSEIHKIRNKDTLMILVLDDYQKSVFYYNTPEQRITKYILNPVSKANYLQVESGLNKQCYVVIPEKEWSCKNKPSDIFVKITKIKMDGKNHTVIDGFKYELVK